MQAEPHTSTEANIRSQAETHLVSRLELTHFRNHAHTQLEVGGSSVVLYGENGAGKTNILEALSLLAPGRGFRRARLSDMDGDAPWTIFAQASGAIGEVDIGTAREVQVLIGEQETTPPACGGGRGGAVPSEQSIDGSVPAAVPPLTPPRRRGG